MLNLSVSSKTTWSLHNFTTILKVSLISSKSSAFKMNLFSLNTVFDPVPKSHNLGWLPGSSQFSHGHDYAIHSSFLSVAAYAKGAP